MPSLLIQPPNGQARSVLLHKRITTLGAADGCDVVLSGAEVGDVHAHIRFDGKLFHLVAAEKQKLSVNGRRSRKHEVCHGDKITIGGFSLRFSIYDPPSDQLPGLQQSLVYRQLLDLSSKLLAQYRLPDVLEELMDAVISVTKATKGFLVLLRDDEMFVKVARNLHQENVEDAIEQLSDSIVSRVIRTREPLIVSDALHDDEFSSSKSIISLRLTSAMCVPLNDNDRLLGLIYVGNDSPVQLFDREALDVLTIFAAQAGLILRNALLINELQIDNQALTKRLEAQRFGTIVGASAGMKDLYQRLMKVAPTDIGVLITGETGTGKELVARELHGRSLRAKGPFVSINCGAIPENLLESELFGYARGAFTGAVTAKRGKFQAAHRGTLFLDEIGELPLLLQVKLLRVLEDKAVVRVGETQPEPVDIRIIAATNRNLANEVAAGRFREDLFYRLNVVHVALPPLRERGADILLIAQFLLRKLAEELGAKVHAFAPETVAAMREYSWPGNIRELDNRIRRAVVLSDRETLLPEDLELTGSDEAVLPLAEAKEEFQRRYINQILERNGGNRTTTARLLGVDPRTIFRHLEREEELLNERDAS